MSLDLYIGPMFAGKSSAILGVVRRNDVIGRKTLCITSALDKRYTTEAKIVSHNKESYPAVAVNELLPLLVSAAFKESEAIIIEEAQFFPDLREFALSAVEDFGKAVICVGLDGDSERRPFGHLLDLIPYADKVQKFTALCMRCHNGTDAIFTLRKAGAPGSQIAVGGQDTYEPVCRKHYIEGMHENKVTEFIASAAAGGAGGEAPAAGEVYQRCISTFGQIAGKDVYQQLLSEKMGVKGPSLR
jgi:thymidine kinase